MNTITKNGSRAVVTYTHGTTEYHSRLYVNCTPSRKDIDGDATLIHASHKTLTGAKKWAEKQLSA